MFYWDRGCPCICLNFYCGFFARGNAPGRCTLVIVLTLDRVGLERRRYPGVHLRLNPSHVEQQVWTDQKSSQEQSNHDKKKSYRSNMWRSHAGTSRKSALLDNCHERL